MIPPDFTRAVWRKSRHSDANGGQCVEVAFLNGAVGLRDSKDNRQGRLLVCTRAEWDAFAEEIRRTAVVAESDAT
ncbi:DUF397 domain-containing protein [Sphaerisporangium sp. NPDC051017]|uniref:DUF397 domain-containing protein n=1 Tax=Sphaerisporangium sp. NPDC051017 TaxID=3154636 RepID=UPI00342B8EDC